MALTKVTHSMILGDPAYLIDFGGGVGKTAAENDAAFTAAFAANNTVILPSGTITYSTTIALNSNKSLIGSGFGELAIYWFLKKTYPSIQDTRYLSSGAADMVIEDIGIEVKAYPMGATDIKIGKFRSAGKEEGKKNNIILNTVLGLNTLMSKISLSESDIKAAKKEGLTNDAGNFRYNTLFTAFEKISKLHKVIEDEPMLQSFNVFEYLKNNINTVYSYLNVPYTDDIKKFASDNAKQLLWNFTRAKLLEKPGINGYIVNCDRQGKMEWLYVDKNLLNDVNFPSWFKGDEVYASAGELYINKGFFKNE